jgi:hypothetical protein
MISSDVMPWGGMFSSGPSWAVAGNAVSKPPARTAINRKLRSGHFMALFYRISSESEEGDEDNRCGLTFSTAKT